MPFSRLLTLLLVAVPAGLQAQSAIDKAAWLAGCWEAKSANRTVIEMWMAPDGGMMLGASRSVVNGTVREFEHLHLRARGDTLVYTALPSGQNETDFTGVPTDETLTFENPRHDFPTRIVYRRIGSDSANARVEGPGKDGAMRGFDVQMAHVPCAQ